MLDLIRLFKPDSCCEECKGYQGSQNIIEEEGSLVATIEPVEKEHTCMLPEYLNEDVANPLTLFDYLCGVAHELPIITGSVTVVACVGCLYW